MKSDSSSGGMNRRRFLKVLGVTGGGAAALSGCSTDRVEKLIPYLVPPPDHVPGRATWYATTCRECPAGCGLHVRTREGRAVKVEGNPDSAINGGRLCARGQASLQGLYNPDRVRSPMARNDAGDFEPITWDDAIARLVGRLRGIDPDGVWFLTGGESGTFDRLVNEWLRALGSAHRVVYEPFGYEALRHANREVFGVETFPRFHFEEAEFLISFGVDFLETWQSPVEQARGFAAAHGYGDSRMGRYVHVEPRMSMTAMSADEWVAPRPGTEGLVALAMAHVILRDRLTRPPADVGRVRGLIERHSPVSVARATEVSADTIERLAREFASVPSLALAGGMGAQHEHAHGTAIAVNLLNYVAGNVGRTVTFGADIDPAAGSTYRGLDDLIKSAEGGDVEVLLVHGGVNAVHAAPQGERFRQAMQRVGFKVSFARFMDETAVLADLLLPDHDPLEQWNDYEPRAGVYALQQPVMQPLFDTRQTGDVLLQVLRELGAAGPQAGSYKDYLMDGWRGLQRRLGDRRPFDAFWTESLQHGGLWRDAPESGARLARSAGGLTEIPVGEAPGEGFTLIAYPSPALYDGRGANRPWLQELPDPVTKVTWGSWVEVHPETAARLGISEGDQVEVRSGAGSVSVPAYLYPGLRKDVVAMPLGQGHTAFGRYAEGRGANAYALLASEPTEFGGVGHYTTVTLRPTGRHEVLAKTEGRRRQMERGIAQAVTLAEIAHPGEAEHAQEEHAEHAAPVPEHIERVLDEWQEVQYREQERGAYAGVQPRWAMAIDLSRCTGCSACVTACHAENNIPTVGPDLVRYGREMSWLRIERYFEGGEEEPLEVRVLPMLCQQCGNAPCEPVCPVFAAYHTPDGLNAQVYNRCVGTRYCSNNCPYKVRYFNWFDYQEPGDPFFAFPEPLHWLLNPDVTVRSKGVMEKCTFCVQRIRDRQNEAKLAGVEIQDGEIVTACEQTCPSEAIVFGDLNDPDSRVRKLAEDPRGYHVLESLNTRPAVTYLKKVRNLVEA